MANFVGLNGTRALFSNEEGSLGVIVDTRVDVIVASGSLEDFSSLGPWEGGEFNEANVRLADGYFSAHDRPTPEPTGRMYTVPSGVRKSARRALSSDPLDVSPATLYMGTLLAAGGQVSFGELTSINSYFEGRSSSSDLEDTFYLYGGNAGSKWASSIVNTEGLTASTAPLASDLSSMLKDNPEAGPEFLIRVDTDNGDIDRLYRIDLDKRTYVWDTASWVDLGQTEWNVWDYDRALDTNKSSENFAHILIDPESALRTATLFSDLGSSISVDDINPLESALVQESLTDTDWGHLDTVLTAAGNNPNDGIYSEEERSANASKQVRDGSGKFAKAGTRVMVNGNPTQTGKISRVNNSDGTVEVALESGGTVKVPGKSVEGIGEHTVTIPGRPVEIPRVDFSGILAEPRTPHNREVGQIPGTLPALSTRDLHSVINNFPEWVQKQRDSFKPASQPGGVTVQSKNSLSRGSKGAALERTIGRTVQDDAYSHPLLREYLRERKNRINYHPITAAGGPHNGVCIVLLPEGSSSIHDASSEDAAHLTTVWLGTTDDVTDKEFEDIVEQIRSYAVNVSPITIPVKESGTLGDEGAEVVFLEPTDSAVALRDGLLEEGSPIWAQFSSVEQFPTWIPHVTTGYPESPTRADFLDDSITFDRIALWYGDERVISPLGTPTLVAAATSEVEEVDMTPDTSDVTPVYMAVVSPDDVRAVFDLISLVPATSKSPQPSVYRREDGAWIRDDTMMVNLKSATPPPVIPLDEALLDDVLQQVDEAQGASEDVSPPEEVQVVTEPDPVTASAYDELSLMVLWGPNPDIMLQALTAAGGADRNRGGAEKLRRYWLHGPGALKIRWGTPGDWTRCVRNLSKYMGPRARGYCALRHKEATGMWTGDKENRQTFAANTPTRVVSTNLVKSLSVIHDERTAFARRNAPVTDARNIEYDTTTTYGLTAAAAAVNLVEPTGGAFFIPLALPEGVESGDGRKIDSRAVDIRDLPISLLWQIKTDEGHTGSVVVGRIERLGWTGKGIGGGYGHFDVGVYGREAERMVRAGMLRFVSSDMDNFEAEHEETEASDSSKIGKSKLSVKKARVMAVTIVAKPAFQECTIEMVPEPFIEELDVLPEGIYTEEPDPVDALALVAAGYIAEAVPVIPPREWFDDPELSGPTPLTVTDDGKVFGHVAAWNSAHISPNLKGIEPPRSRSGYAYFHTGVLRTDDGSDVNVGQLTLAGGHADLHFSAKEAVKHYDDTASAVADVHAGEDAYGIWVSGAMRPGVSPQQVRVFRASAPSGDWRPIRGQLEMVAVCQVNVPGFPQARALTASGHMMALVAAGASTLAQLRPDPLAMLANKIEALEQRTDMTNDALFASRVSDALERSMASRASVHEGLNRKADAALERMKSFGYVSKQSREDAAEKGEALPDGSYPIRNVEDLKNAIQAFGRSKETDRTKVRRHIIKRARALGSYDLIPDGWKSEEKSSTEASILSVRERAEAARAEFSSLTAAAASDEEEKRRKRLEDAIETLEKPVEEMSPTEKARAVSELRSKGLDVPEELVPQKGKETDEDGRAKYKPGYQPRDYNGRFRLVLARLKEDMGVSGNQDIVEDIEATDSRIRAGDYADSVRAGLDLTAKLDRLDAGSLNKESLNNVRATAGDLATAISNLPLPFKNQAQKVRFSDIPPNLRGLMDEMVDRVHSKIGNKEGQVATQRIRQLMSGSDMFSQSEISQEMSKLLRLLT